MKNAIIVGGTGMLRAATLTLARDGWRIYAIARDETDLGALASEAAESGGVIIPLPCDYCNLNELARRVSEASRITGGFSLAVCWIHQHTSAPEAPGIIGDILAEGATACDYYDIVGSSADASDDGQFKIEARLKKLPKLTYHKIVLGSATEGSRRRWLTHEEISLGVLKAIISNAPLFKVGE